jgi:hypothetical protein
MNYYKFFCFFFFICSSLSNAGLAGEAHTLEGISI